MITAGSACELVSVSPHAYGLVRLLFKDLNIEREIELIADVEADKLEFGKRYRLEVHPVELADG